MAFETFAAAVLLLAVPVVGLLAFTRGVATLGGGSVRHDRRPLAFWLHLAFWIGFLLFTASLLWAGDRRGFFTFTFVALLLSVAQMLPGLAEALRTGRVSATERSAHPAAYWSAMSGGVLTVLLLTCFALYLLVDFVAR